MCGLAGYLQIGARLPDDVGQTIWAMTNSLEHRGPDQKDVFYEESIALGHRRLAVLDPLERGKQPMRSGNGRWVIAYNGEVFNHHELKSELGPEVHFRTTTDTEVILECLDRWGFEKTIPKLNGIFAFAAWDRRDKTLYLTRDRLGVKPLYWATFGGALVFGTELKVMMRHPEWRPELDPAGMRDYLDNMFIAAPRTAFRNCWKLLPGHYIEMSADDRSVPQSRSYWSLLEMARWQKSQGDPNISLDAATDALDTLLNDVVEDQMVADVPVGAFLSGGIDSSLVVSIMARKTKLQTFCIGYAEKEFDESVHARAIAEHLGVEHNDLIVTPEQSMAVIPRIPEMFDEPFADPSQIPTHIVSAFAKQKITVALAGDGGDEFFGGFPRYLNNMYNWSKISWLPRALRNSAAATIDAIPPAAWRTLTKPILADGAQSIPFAAQMLRMPTIGVYEKRMNYLGLDECIRIPESVRDANEASFAEPLGLPELFDEMMYHDQAVRLPDQMCVKGDRASMICPIEVRAPLLDNRVIDFAWTLPTHLKVTPTDNKIILKKLLGRYLPEPLFMRPKTGFHIPIRRWLKSDLKSWAEDLIFSKRLDHDPFLDADRFRGLWRGYQENAHERVNAIWIGLVYLSWCSYHKC